jgi:hypothetical protein
MKKELSYIYLDDAYQHLAIHRKVIAYDPRNTDNPIIFDYFNTIKRNRNNSAVYYRVIEKELNKYNNSIYPPSPISFQMIYHEMNLAWIDIIHQMLFIENAYETFYGEYKDVIENIILYDTVDLKESLVYRYFSTGESIFHMAGKIWLFEKYMDKQHMLITERNYELDEEIKYVLNCYQKLEEIMNSKFSIIYMTDFFDISLMDYLQDFLSNLKVNRII